MKRSTLSGLAIGVALVACAPKLDTAEATKLLESSNGNVVCAIGSDDVREATGGNKYVMRPTACADALGQAGIIRKVEGTTYEVATPTASGLVANRAPRFNYICGTVKIVGATKSENYNEKGAAKSDVTFEVKIDRTDGAVAKLCTIEGPEAGTSTQHVTMTYDGDAKRWTGGYWTPAAKTAMPRP